MSVSLREGFVQSGCGGNYARQHTWARVHFWRHVCTSAEWNTRHVRVKESFYHRVLNKSGVRSPINCSNYHRSVASSPNIRTKCFLSLRATERIFLEKKTCKLKCRPRDNGISGYRCWGDFWWHLSVFIIVWRKIRRRRRRRSWLSGGT